MNMAIQKTMRARTGKKAFVFSLDILIAVFLTILVLLAAHRQIMSAEANRVPYIQMSAAGSDIVAVLDYKGVLQTLDDDFIESEMNDLLPLNYNMMLKIVADDGTVLYAGDSLPENQFVGTGTRFFTIKENDLIKNYAYVSYWIWVR